MGSRRITDRDLQAQCGRSAALRHRSAHPPRQRLAASSHRRAHALALGNARRRLTVKVESQGSWRSAYDQVFVDTEERAVIIVDQLGRTNSASSHAYRLLEMAFSPRWDSRARWHLSRYAQPELARLCRSLLTSTVGAISTEPPVCRRRNAWGEFVLRAYWLEPTDGTAASRFIAITIVQREPKHLRLLRQIERLPLTGREKQLCLLLTRDQARADIADTMGVSEATVISHRRNVFDKLGVHSRIGLIEFLDQQR